MRVTRQRYNQLIELINEHAYLYYALDKTTISDAVYDSLVLELKQFEADNPDLISPLSRTQRVGASRSKGFTKASHSRPMISLADIFSIEELEAWYARMIKLFPSTDIDLFTDIKMDGAGLSLIYMDGVLQQAITRGDGRVGEEVTQNARTIMNVPLSFKALAGYEHLADGRTEIRGEVLIHKSDFEEINIHRAAQGLEIYANPRNLAAGTLRQLDPQAVSDRKLRFYGYEIIRQPDDLGSTFSDSYSALAACKITHNIQAIAHKDLKSVEAFVDYWNQARLNLPYQTDGIVIRLNNRQLFASAGVVGKSPRAAVAYKYPAEQATTVVKDIVLNIGRTGVATPVAVFNPVQVAGTTVQHASLHNRDEIERKDIRIGDTVVIYKAGDIIPQVESVITELRPKSSSAFDFEAELKRQFPELKFEREPGGVAYRAKGGGKLVLIRALEHYSSRGALDIDTLGSKNVQALVESSLVTKVSDIYKLNLDNLLSLDRFAEVSANKLLEAIKQSKNPPFSRLIFALGIRHVGQQTAYDLSTNFESMDELANASIGDLTAIDGVGDVVADSIVAWFAEPENISLLAELKDLGVSPQNDARPTKGKLVGLGVAVTGKLFTLTRDEAREAILANGGQFNTSVTKATNYLISNGTVTGSKLKQAQKFGTKILTEDEFLTLIG